MRKLAAILVLTVFSGLFYCCSTGNPEGTPAGEINYDSLGPIVAAYLPAREGDTVIGWGMVRPDGTMLFSNRFSQRPSAVVNGYFTVREGKGISVYRADTVPRAVNGLTDLVYAGVMSNGLMPVTRRGQRIEIVDGEGLTRMVLTSIDGREIVKTSAYFIDGVLPVYTQDGHWGAINTQGEMVVEPVYDSMPVFSERIAAVTRSVIETKDSLQVTVTRRYLINNRGKVIFTFPEGMTPEGEFRSGRMAVRMQSGGTMGFLNVDGRISPMAPVVRTIGEYDEEYTVWADRSENYGLDAADGQTLIEPAYSAISLTADGQLLVKNHDGSYAVTDSIGSIRFRLNGFEKVTDLQYIAPGIVTPFCFLGEGFAGVVMLDRKGHRLGKGAFAAIATDISLLDDGCVYTDYFNAQVAVHSIVSRLDDRGWSGVELGRQMSTLTDSLNSELTRTRSVRIGRDSQYMLDIDAIAYSSAPVAVDSVNAEGHHSYLANPGSKLVYIRIEAAVPVARYPEMLQHMGAEMVPRGFRAEKIRDEYAVYARDDFYVIVTPRPALQGLYFYVMNKAFYDETAPQIIADGEKLYRQATQPQNSRNQ